MKNRDVSSILTSLVGAIVVVAVAGVAIAVGAIVVVLVVVLDLVMIVVSVVCPLLSTSVPGSFPVLVLLSDLVLGGILLVVLGSIGISVDTPGSFQMEEFAVLPRAGPVPD